MIDRLYRLPTVLIVATIALVLGIGLGLALSLLGTGSAGVGLSSITSVGGAEPRQGGR